MLAGVSDASMALVTSQMDNSQNCILTHTHSGDKAKEAKDVDGSSERKLSDNFVVQEYSQIYQYFLTNIFVKIHFDFPNSTNSKYALRNARCLWTTLHHLSFMPFRLSRQSKNFISPNRLMTKSCVVSREHNCCAELRKSMK